ncbi:MAG TPA: hypothetical protein EYN74_07325 [Nitrospirales bacterium]|nr:hypothetical protein [Nitrospirales bacterium]
MGDRHHLYSTGQKICLPDCGVGLVQQKGPFLAHLQHHGHPLLTLDEALSQYGPPEIFNTDQGSQFTSEALTGRLKEEGTRISMDGKGRWRDKAVVERLWHSVKYEKVCLQAYEAVTEAKRSIGNHLDLHNARHLHSSLDGVPPDQFYSTSLLLPMAV